MNNTIICNVFCVNVKDINMLNISLQNASLYNPVLVFLKVIFQESQKQKEFEVPSTSKGAPVSLLLPLLLWTIVLVSNSFALELSFLRKVLSGEVLLPFS